MINFTKELPQITTVIQSGHREHNSKGSNDIAIWRQSMISAVLRASLLPFLLRPCPLVTYDCIDVQVECDASCEFGRYWELLFVVFVSLFDCLFICLLVCFYSL